MFTALILSHLLCLTAAASPYESEEFKNTLATPVSEPNYFTMIFGLVFVVCLIYLTGFLYQKLIGINLKINKNISDTADLNKIKILSSAPLGNRKNLYVVQLNGKTLLIGACDMSLGLIKEFSKEEIEDYKNVLKTSNEDKNG